MHTSNDLKYMRDAKHLGEDWSKCLSRQIGAIIVRDKTVLSRGYNGPPRGVPHCDVLERLNEVSRLAIEYDSKLKFLAGALSKNVGKCPRKVFSKKSGALMNLCQAAHAERNALINAAREGISIKGSSLYCYCPLPCKDCAVEIINAGIEKVYHLDVPDYDPGSRWLFGYAGVTMIPITVEEIDGEI